MAANPGHGGFVGGNLGRRPCWGNEAEFPGHFSIIIIVLLLLVVIALFDRTAGPRPWRAWSRLTAWANSSPCSPRRLG